MNKKRILSLILAGALTITAIGFTGCDNDDSNDDKQAVQTEQLQQQATSKLGMPNIRNFYEKKMMKEVMEDCDDSNLITYVYVKNEMTGKYNFLGEAIGYGLPYGTEYTNPQRIAKGSETPSSGNITLPQADPNGLYKAENVDATWVMLIDPNTKQAKPVYVEDKVTISPFKLDKSKCDASTLPSDY